MLHSDDASNPDIFKAYDVRGAVSRRDQRRGRARDRARLRRVSAGDGASRSARDMRLSSPALAAAFIDGAASQGCDVVDYGMMATDMLYFAVASDGLRRRRADHRLAQSRSSTTA